MTVRSLPVRPNILLRWCQPRMRCKYWRSTPDRVSNRGSLFVFYTTFFCLHHIHSRRVPPSDQDLTNTNFCWAPLYNFFVDQPTDFIDDEAHLEEELCKNNKGTLPALRTQHPTHTHDTTWLTPQIYPRLFTFPEVCLMFRIICLVLSTVIFLALCHNDLHELDVRILQVVIHLLLQEFPLCKFCSCTLKISWSTATSMMSVSGQFPVDPSRFRYYDY